MDKNRDQIKLENIVKNISYFEFKSDKAIKLKHDMRCWYYGKRDPIDEKKLKDRFCELFSGNMIIDVLGGLIWNVSVCSDREDVIAPLDNTHIVGATLRAYTPGTEKWKNQKLMETRINAYKEEAKEKLAVASEALYRQIQNEKAFYRQIGMSMLSIPFALLGLAAILVGTAQILSLVSILLHKGGLLEMAQSSPLFTSLGEKPTLAVILASFVCTLFLFAYLPALFLTLKAGVIWIFYEKNCKKREELAWRILQGVKTEGFDSYCTKLCVALKNLAQLPYDFPEIADPSYALLGERGVKEIFSLHPIQPLPNNRNLREFCAKLDKKHIYFKKMVIVASLIVLGVNFLNRFLLR